ncbi:winged helix-turn-helix domain-containing protein [Segetibacter sp. 3557_3]|uniref:winged helix-turn-helix domain-containing protein n=1 Tax=Segetibacter sp. 3557_3 TaxID=2547429 RepID=UPI001A9D8042|nr:winged helix-turn-helix domain-containing protein [Segetibacter sp. 3557_3]
MSVNPAFAGVFSNRLVMRYGSATMLLAALVIFSGFKEHSGRDSRAKQVNLLIREIGNRLLLQAGDSTSRVLPVIETKEGTFLLRFEKELVFSHDSLMVMSDDLLPKTAFRSGYAVTVQDCTKRDIVYGFQVSNSSPDILPCKRRSQPPGCYTIEFAFPDLYENADRKNSKTSSLTQPVDLNPQEVNPRPEKVTTTTVDIGQETKELKPGEADPKKFNSRLEGVKTSIAGNPLRDLVYAGVLVLLAGILFMGRFGKSLRRLPLQRGNSAFVNAPVPEFAALGKFLFDVQDRRLLLGTDVISLTDKECKVLELLHESFGELIPRETLLQKVWIDEGVITGRSLDMFVSKLRKKLSPDPELRITNIHGKGYKLEILEGLKI